MAITQTQITAFLKTAAVAVVAIAIINRWPAIKDVVYNVKTKA